MTSGRLTLNNPQIQTLPRLSEDDAKKAVKSYFESYPGLQGWITKQRKSE